MEAIKSRETTLREIDSLDIDVLEVAAEAINNSLIHKKAALEESKIIDR